MRTVIQQGIPYRFDFQLCKILRLHQKVVEHFEHNKDQLPTTLMQSSGATSILNKWEQALILATSTDGIDDLEILADEMIYDIIARCQGLRILEDKWLSRQLISSDFLSTGTTSNPSDFIRAHQVLLQRAEEFRDEDGISRHRQTPESQIYVDLNADQRGRFHAAIYPATFHIQVEVLVCCRTRLGMEVHNFVLDDLDRLAVFRFLYHHSLPLSGVFLADRDSSKLPLTFLTKFNDDAVYATRLLQTFLLAGQTYMQPPDVIDLTIRSETSRRAPYPQMTLPPSSERWMRLSNNFAMPTNVQNLSH
ncbi:hypothetical protein T440DRAFT_513082 [Plenodomus tracheiphilus IPT5]|uniref:Uncharacterized protein n=1 Tax=Plenodomus tracheiphilus IPT5 TaxID=1408161 RepID=A0A6A7BKS3_9PLEO|nr:hypothetical protein T440DRAFT_513082 [Plenodomus tracheiphilus IPT5]